MNETSTTRIIPFCKVCKGIGFVIRPSSKINIDRLHKHMKPCHLCSGAGHNGTYVEYVFKK